MKRVLIFSLSYYPYVGGAEVAIKEITDRIRIEDIEFHMITLRFAEETCQEQIGNVMVHRVGNGASFFGKMIFIPRAALYALRLNRTKHFDALWAMMSYMLFPIVFMRWCGVSIPYLLTLQEGDPFEHVFKRWRILPFRPLLAYGFKHANAVQPISTFLAKWAVQAGFRGTPEVIPNGVNIKHFTSETVRTLVRTRKISNEKVRKVRLVTTSRLVEKNATDDVIRALALLPKEVSFFVYGTGHDEKKLRALAKSSGVESRVKFMGYIDHKHLPEHLARSDIFVRPSRSEGMGNSFIEAMAVGLPVIATQEGGIADFLFDAKRNPDKEPTGWAVDKNSPEQIAMAVKDITDHSEQAIKITKYARSLVLKKYDWDSIAKREKELFNKLFATN